MCRSLSSVLAHSCQEQQQLYYSKFKCQKQIKRNTTQQQQQQQQHKKVDVGVVASFEKRERVTIETAATCDINTK